MSVHDHFLKRSKVSFKPEIFSKVAVLTIIHVYMFNLFQSVSFWGHKS